MAYTWEEIKFLGKEWWGEVPFKEKLRGSLPIFISMLGPALNKAVPMLTLSTLKAARLAGIGGFGAFGWSFFWVNFQLILGWVLGWILADLDHVFYALTCNPKEETCQRVRREIELRRWNGAWRILISTVNDREKLPIRNVVTMFVIGIMGIWVSTSTISALALGLVFGLGVRILIDMWQTKKYQKWYWVFKREFSFGEHRILSLLATGIVIYHAIRIVRI